MSEAYAELGGVLRPSPRARLDPAAALRLSMQLQGLKGVKTHPGSGHSQFLKDVCRQHPDTLSEAQREHIQRLAWRYRWQLKPALRPAADPELNPVPEAN